MVFKRLRDEDSQKMMETLMQQAQGMLVITYELVWGRRIIHPSLRPQRPLRSRCAKAPFLFGAQ